MDNPICFYPTIQRVTLRNIVLHAVAGWFLTINPVNADDFVEPDSHDELMRLLESQTNLATRSRLNVDYVPGMVTIMTGEEMRRRGFATLWDAFAFIPGVQKNIDASGQRTLIVRGIGKTAETTKVKLMLNDVEVNPASSASSGTLFSTPVTQINRIEFIRGPGSAIYGEYALMGVLNVITLETGNSLSASVDSNSARFIQGQYQFSDTNGLAGSINLAANAADGETIEAGNDATPQGVEGYAPGQVNNKNTGVSLILDMGLGATELSLQYQQVNRGDHFGINNYLPPPQKQTVISDSLFTFKLAHSLALDDDLQARLEYSHVDNRNEKNSQFLGVAEVFGGLADQADVIADVDLVERRDKVAVDFNYSFEQHQFLTGLAVSKLKVTESQLAINLDPENGLPTDSLNNFPVLVEEGSERNLYSLILQDEYQVNQGVTLTAGLRYDNVDEIEDSLSPRLALVWILNTEQVIKTQYAEAFRPPTLREAAGAIDGKLKPETIDTLEISYITNSDDQILRHVLFYSRIDDFIIFNDSAPFGYSNIAGARSYGYEFELEKNLTSDFYVELNLSLLQSEDISSDKSLYGSTPLVFSLSADYRFNSSIGINAQFVHIAERYRQPDDERASASAEQQLDMTLSWKNFLHTRGLLLTTGLRNVLHQNQHYLATEDSYSGDYLL